MARTRFLIRNECKQEFVKLLNLDRQSALWVVTLVLAMAWPPIYSIYIHPLVLPKMDASAVSTSELKHLLNSRRYTIDVPMELDGHFLTFDVIVDGKVTQGGGTSVIGGSKIVLLLRSDQESRKLEYCWVGPGTVARGVFDNPIERGANSAVRRDGPIKAGDWLLRGGRESVQVYPATEPAEFEVRLAFGKP